ncbi:uncharacterized protein E0L32_002244 [Thyridium curvatum]|uniref:C2 domain-containing protein n=1 Tax=Thyridium curvatum TaxID=1093900 RepID=A0A507API8_9PEZI|nr:uncharacterized protein E0L32_002244 [Thyridium curvatum]TPX06748.1 hypothetical protein E0L32_002244 [Thyridium curvatum]
MAAKIKSHPLNGAHTAGIFSDMSIDGPEIGTLVLIIDRAKNLPNRKTIGKQDPYCAARLGKEAKKTKTDIRGGQTPRWDQELRFTVHDSPDYYQLKISVFNDDKRTDLIGECWIDLRDIIVSGGGQSDSWHTLNCRSKYAGDVRIEITYYDSRPKPEKPVAKAKPVEQPEAHSSLPRGPPKRRPLPSDPVTGQSPQPSIPEHAQTPPRPQPTPPTSYIPNQSPLQAVEYQTPPSRRYPQPQPQSQPEQYSPVPPNGGYAPPTGSADMQYAQRGSMDRPDRYSGHAEESEYGADYRRQSHNRYDSRSSFDETRSSYSMPPVNDPRQLPADEDRPPPPPVHRTRNNSGAAQEAMLRSGYDLSPQKGTPPSMRHDVLRNEAHRKSISSSAYPGRPAYRPYDSAPAPLPSSPDYQSPEPHQPSPPRHHSYDSNYDPHFRSMQPTVEDAPESPSPVVQHSFRKSGSRAPPSPYDYDEPDYNNGASPAPLNLGGRGSSASGHYTQSPAPIQNGQRRPETNSYAHSGSPISSREREYVPQMSTSPGAHDSRGSYSKQYSDPRDTFVDEPVNSAGQYGLPAVPASLVPGMDPNLSMDIAERINEDSRRHQRRNTQPPMETPPRGRRMIEAGPGYAPEGSPQPYQTPQHTPQHQQSFDRSPVVYSGGQSPSIVKPRAISPNPYHSGSPNPHHTIKRKSISPAPPPSEGRRLSGIPFGPDDYDALNPSVVSANSNESMRSDMNDAGKIVTHDGKEIDPSDHLPMDTWAPEPEPKKPSAPSTPTNRPSPAGAQPMPTSTGRRQLRIAGRPQSMASSPVTYGSDPPEPSPQPPPSTGRNRLQKKANRQSAMPVVMSGANGPGLGGGGGGGSPLAPLPHGHDNYTPPRQMVRASTFDSYYAPPNENHPVPSSSRYGRPRSRGDERGGFGYHPGPAGAPPVPAKIPLMNDGSMGPGGGGGVGGYGGGMGMGMMMGGGGGGGGELALAEEMSRIDIGTGRARRHQRY